MGHVFGSKFVGWWRVRLADWAVCLQTQDHDMLVLIPTLHIAYSYCYIMEEW